jgi:hypothetical protein
MLPAPGHFTTEYVAAVLERAGQTLLCLPIAGARPSGYRSNMPDIVREVTEAYGYSDEMVRPPVPSPAAISEMDRVLGWVSLIPQERFVIRRVVQCRALVNPRTGRHVYSWRKLAIFLHCDLRAAQRWHAEGIATIVSRLNQPGLCNVAAGSVGPSRQLVREALARIKAAEPVRQKPITAVEFV